MMDKIKEIHLNQFGKFKNRSLSLDGEISVFYGLNEAGKSTIVQGLETLYFGFSPANLGAHDYAPWTGDTMEISAVYETFLLKRKMGSSIVSQVSKESRLEAISNKALSTVNHISRSVFRSVFSLSSEELAAIEGKSWEEVEDKVLLNYDSETLKSPKHVMSELDLEISKLWRDSNRGKSVLKQLEGDIKALKKEIRAMRLKDQALQKMHLEKEKLKDEKTIIENQIQKISKGVTLFEETLEIRKIKSNMVYLESQYICGESFKGMAKDLHKRYEENQGTLLRSESDVEVLKEEIKDLESSFETVPDLYETYKVLKGHLKQFEREHRKILTDTALLEDKEKRFKAMNQQMDLALNACHLKRQHLNVVKELDVLILKALVHQRDLAYDESISKRKSPLLPILSAVAGLVSGGVGYFVGPPILTALGLFLFASGITALYMGAQGGITGRSETYNMLVAEISDKLEGLSSEVDVAKGCSLKWLEDISTLQGKTIDYLSLHGEVKELKEALDSLKKALSEACKCPEESPLDLWLQELEQVIYTGDKASAHNDIISKQLDKMSRDLDQKKSIYEKSQTVRESLIHQFSVLDTDFDKAYGVYLDNIQLYDKWRVYREEYNSFDDIEALSEKVDRVTLDKASYHMKKQELDALKEEEKTVAVDLAELDLQIKHSLEGDTLKDLIGRLEALEDEKEEVEADRDKLIVFREVIRLADQKYQENNKPKVIEQAGKYLSHMTDGRYHALYFDETQKLHVHTENGVKALTEAFSKGTKNQMYLAFRLSLMDHLDPEKKVPLILDDAFVNFDRDRFENVFELIEKISKTRQILFFTCHGFYRDFICDKMGINVIEI